MKIAIGADHAGFEYKAKLKEFLENKGFKVEDLGTHSTDSVDYPDFAHPLAQMVERQEANWGILICGSGRYQGGFVLERRTCPTCPPAQ